MTAPSFVDPYIWANWLRIAQERGMTLDQVAGEVERSGSPELARALREHDAQTRPQSRATTGKQTATAKPASTR